MPHTHSRPFMNFASRASILASSAWVRLALIMPLLAILWATVAWAWGGRA